MGDISRNVKWKYISMECRQFMEYRRNIVGPNGMQFLGQVNYIQLVWWLTCRFLNCQCVPIVYIMSIDGMCCCWFKNVEEKRCIKLVTDDIWDWNHWYVHIFNRHPVLMLAETNKNMVLSSKIQRPLWWLVYFSLYTYMVNDI